MKFLAGKSVVLHVNVNGYFVEPLVFDELLIEYWEVIGGASWTHAPEFKFIQQINPTDFHRFKGEEHVISRK